MCKDTKFHYTELAENIKIALPSAEKSQNELLNFEREYEKSKKVINKNGL